MRRLLLNLTRIWRGEPRLYPSGPFEIIYIIVMAALVLGVAYYLLISYTDYLDTLLPQ